MISRTASLAVIVYGMLLHGYPATISGQEH
jgi:hypothetical protein